MKYTQLTINNFLSFGEKQVVPLSGRGMVLVEGDNCDDTMTASNGAGKSAIFEAFFWALTGKTLRGLTGDAVINREVGKDCFVSLEGDHQGKAWTVYRSRKCGHGCPLMFIYGGHNLSAGNESQQTQRVIERTLAIDPGVLAQTLVFGQGDAWRFSSLNDAKRKALLERVVGIDGLDDARAWVKSQLAVSQGDATRAGAWVDVCRNALASHTEALKGMKQQRKDMARKAMARARADIEAERRKLAKVAKPKWSAVSPLKQAQKAVKQGDRQIAKLQEAEAQARAHNDALNEALQKAREAIGVSSFAFDDAIKQIMSIDAELKEVGKVKDTCHVCHQPVPQLKFKRMISSLHSKKKVWEKNAQAFSDAREKHRANVQELKQEQTALQLDKFRGRMQEAQSNRDAAAARLHALKEADATTSNAVKAAEQRIAELESVIADARIDLTTLGSVEMQIKKKRKQARLNLAEAGAKVEALDHHIRHLQFWVQGFGDAGIKSHLLDHVTPMLNTHANVLARDLMDGLKLTFTTQKKLKSGEVRDKFELAIETLQGEAEYEAHSSGERRKIDIIVAMTLQRLLQARQQTASNVVLFDEVFESLDETACEAVLKLLRRQAETCDTIYVVSHLEWLRASFPAILRVVKQGQISKIEWA